MPTDETRSTYAPALYFGTMPSPARAYGRIVTRALATRAKRPKTPTADDVPRLELLCAPLAIDRAHLAAYRALCGYTSDDSAALPTLYPQLLAAPLHLEALTHRSFPLPTLGLVHMHNRVLEYAPILAHERVALRCTVTGARETSRGIEFDLRTEARVGDTLRWESSLTALSRTRGASSRSSSSRASAPASSGDAVPLPTDAPGAEPFARIPFTVDEDMGRRYARVARDLNPIHQHALLAKPFGFSRAIVHGTWSLARCLAELERQRQLPPLGRALEARFRKPVLLPSRVLLVASRTRESSTIAFALRTHDDRSTHLEGTVGPHTA